MLHKQMNNISTPQNNKRIEKAPRQRHGQRLCRIFFIFLPGCWYGIREKSHDTIDTNRQHNADLGNMERWNNEPSPKHYQNKATPDGPKNERHHAAQKKQNGFHLAVLLYPPTKTEIAYRALFGPVLLAGLTYPCRNVSRRHGTLHAVAPVHVGPGQQRIMLNAPDF